jgi:uncharacterized membrane protein YphA (DoxX/SURF4 family)
MPDSAWAPLAGAVDVVLLIARVILGGTMLYYGWPKVKDPRKNAFDEIARAHKPFPEYSYDLLLLALALVLLAVGPGAYALA